LIFGGLASFFSFFICDIFLKSSLGWFGFKNIYDIAAFPLLALSLFILGLLILPLQNSYTRRRERKADEFALTLTGDKKSFILLMEKLGKKNLADFFPNKIIELLLYDHPPIGKRIAYASKFYKGEERRKYIRLDTVLPVEFQIVQVGRAGFEIVSPWQQGFTQDISYGGIALKTNFLKQNIIALDREKISLFLNIHLPIKKHPIYAQARCVWVRKIDEGPYSYILGLDFKTIRPQDRKILVNYAYWRKYLPRITLVLIIFLAMTLFSVYIYNLRLSLKNQKLIDNLSRITRELTLAETRIKEIDTERKRLEDNLSLLVGRIKELNDRLSQIEATKEEEISRYKEKLEDEMLARERYQEELRNLKDKIEQLNKDKKSLERVLVGLVFQKKEMTSLIAKQKEEKILMQRQTIKKMYNWIKTRQNPKTGLIASFLVDKTIEDWAFTYDQALAALVFTLFGDNKRAEKIFDFYRQISLKKDAFANAYYSSGGEVSEYIVHSGPNIWVGIAILQYIYKTQNMEYLPLVEHIAEWLIKLQNEDEDGGIRGGPLVDWYSTEHNLDAYAFFNMLYQITKKPKYLTLRDKVLSWLKLYAYNKGTVPIWRGKGDATIATDTYFWSIAAIGPEKLSSIGMDPDKIIKFAEDNCRVKTEFIKPNKERVTISGFDFAKARHIPRGGIVSSEFTAQVVVTYKIMHDYYKKKNIPEKADMYEDKARDLLNELEKMIILSISKVGQSFPCLPYATQENADTGHGWFTPKGKYTGSLSGTIYTIFAYYGFNPLSFDNNEKETLNHF
jgi:hypothetical protein